MKLHELAYFTDNVQGMTDFYRGLLGTDPVAKSEDMAICVSARPGWSPGGDHKGSRVS